MVVFNHQSFFFLLYKTNKNVDKKKLLSLESMEYFKVDQS